MNVFMSWSGDEGRAFTLMLADWLSAVLQSVDVHVSTREPLAVMAWLDDVLAVPSGSDSDGVGFGIVCVPSGHELDAQLAFETGALLRLGSERVKLFQLGQTDAPAEGPIGALPFAAIDRPTIYEMVGELNRLAGERAVEPKRLDDQFERCWPEFDLPLAVRLSGKSECEAGEPEQNGPEGSPGRANPPVDPRLDELLWRTRAIHDDLAHLRRVSPRLLSAASAAIAEPCDDLFDDEVLGKFAADASTSKVADLQTAHDEDVEIIELASTDPLFDESMSDLAALDLVNDHLDRDEFAEAERVLRSAIDSHGEAPGYLFKLLEVHWFTRNIHSFRSDAQRLRIVVANDSDECIGVAEEWWADLEPGEPLFELGDT